MITLNLMCLPVVCVREGEDETDLVKRIIGGLNVCYASHAPSHGQISGFLSGKAISHCLSLLR